MIDVIETLEGFDSLRPIWEGLEKNPILRIFQTYAWCRAAWGKCMASEERNRLWILKWQQDGKDDVVIFPFYIDGKGVLRFIFDRDSDLLDTVYLPGGNRHICYIEAIEAILHNKSIKQIRLLKMAGESEALKYFSVLLRGAAVIKDHAFSWLQVEKTDDFVRSLTFMKSNDRNQLKAILRKSKGRDLKIYSARNGDLFPKEEIDGLANAAIASKRRDASFFPNSFIGFTKQLYELNVLDIASLYEGCDCVGINFLLKHGGCVLSWIFINTDNKIPSELCIKYMSSMCVNKAFIFDFGVGAYTYKLRTFRPFVSPTFAILYGKTPFTHVKVLWSCMIRFIKDYGKMFLNRGAR